MNALRIEGRALKAGPEGGLRAGGQSVPRGHGFRGRTKTRSFLKT